jgi:hypothetical protein
MAEKITYQQKYKKGSMVLRDHSLPQFRHVSSSFIVHEAEIKSAGAILKDGVKMEFQDIRVYLKESVIKR